jgi:ABC-type antimicrobial peptide transport system ATPase subunit
MGNKNSRQITPQVSRTQYEEILLQYQKEYEAADPHERLLDAYRALYSLPTTVTVNNLSLEYSLVLARVSMYRYLDYSPSIIIVRSPNEITTLAMKIQDQLTREVRRLGYLAQVDHLFYWLNFEAAVTQACDEFMKISDSMKFRPSKN